MNVFGIMATAGRHRCAERALTCFLEQDYEGEHTLLIHNNSPVELSLSLPPLAPNKKVILLNKCENESGPYRTLGAIYLDSISFVPATAQVLIFWDDDDLYLPNHISEGVKGLKRAPGAIAYKPAFSYYRHAAGVVKVQNTLEPSMFVSKEHILTHGFKNTTSDQHLQWVEALGTGLFVDPNGTPTLIYNWGDTNIPTFKTSGNPGNPENFSNYRSFSQEHGDKILSPISREELQAYFSQVPT